MVILGPLRFIFKLRCKKCGHEWKVYYHVSGIDPGEEYLKRCPKCYSEDIEWIESESFESDYWFKVFLQKLQELQDILDK